MMRSLRSLATQKRQTNQPSLRPRVRKQSSQWSQRTHRLLAAKVAQRHTPMPPQPLQSSMEGSTKPPLAISRQKRTNSRSSVSRLRMASSTSTKSSFPQKRTDQIKISQGRAIALTMFTWCTVPLRNALKHCNTSIQSNLALPTAIAAVSSTSIPQTISSAGSTTFTLRKDSKTK